MDWGALLVGSGFGGVLGTAVNAMFNRRKLGADTSKVGADAAAVISETALELVEPLRRRIAELTKEVDDLRASVRDTTDELDTCRAQSREKDQRLREQDEEIDLLRRQHRLPDGP